MSQYRGLDNPAEIDQRLRRVRAAKMAKLESGDPSAELSTRELDRLMPFPRARTKGTKKRKTKL